MLTTYNFEQGSDEWHDARRGVLTASAIGQLITPKTLKVSAGVHTRSLTMKLAAERITGRTEPTYVSNDMQFGHYIEPKARQLYAENHAPVEQCGFMVADEGGHSIGYSPDGLVGEEGLLEIKYRIPKEHLATICAQAVPTEHMAQCQTGLFVSGREWLDYLSYCPGWPLVVIRVMRIPEWQKAVPLASASFEHAVKEIVALYNLHTYDSPMAELELTSLDVELHL